MREHEESPSTFDVHILGPGALGRLWAAKLSQQLNIGLIGQNSQKVTQELSQESSPSPLTFTLETSAAAQRDDVSEAGIQSITLPKFSAADVSNQNSNQPSITNLLVFTKSYQTKEAILSLASAITPSTNIVLFQNGMGSQFKVLEAFPENPILAATTTEGANRKGDILIHAGRGITHIGGLNQAGIEATPTLASLLSKSGLTVQSNEDIWEKLWLKLVINCGINPFTAICDCPNGQIIHQGIFKSLWPKLVDELNGLLTTAGYSKPRKEIEDLILGVAASTASNISSMLQDIRNQRQTEIEDINGFAADYLKKHELEYSANQQLVDQVNAIRN